MSIIRNNNVYDLVQVDDFYFAQHNDEQDKFNDVASKLPLTIQAILFSEETPKIIAGIYSQFNLSEEQSASLSRLIRKVLVAEVYIGNMIREIQTRLQVPETTARSLANAMAQQLFAPAINEIKAVQSAKFSNTGQPKSQGDPNVIDLRSSN